MHSIQAMCQQHNRHSDERLEASLKSQKEEMALMAAQFQRALQEQHLQHVRETRELHTEIEHLKSIEQSQLEPSLPPPSHPSSPQPPPVFETFHNELVDQLDQLRTIANTISKPVASQPERQTQEKQKLAKPLKPIAFDGVGSWEDYKAQFGLIAEMNGWMDKTKAVYLAASLKGHAQPILGDPDEWSRKDFSSLVTALSCYFGAEHQT